jgi:hypothetical protein
MKILKNNNDNNSIYYNDNVILSNSLLNNNKSLYKSNKKIDKILTYFNTETMGSLNSNLSLVISNLTILISFFVFIPSTYLAFSVHTITLSFF